MNPTIVRSDTRVDCSNTGRPSSRLIFRRGASNNKVLETGEIILRSATMPPLGETKRADPSLEFQRSYSTGGFLQKKYSSLQQELASRARAQELCTRYELNDHKSTELCKMIKNDDAVSTTSNVVHPTTITTLGSPQFTPTLSVKQASQIFAAKQVSRLEQKAYYDPLLSDRERMKAMHKLETQRRKLALHTTSVTPASHSATSISKGDESTQQSTTRVKSSTMAAQAVMFKELQAVARVSMTKASPAFPAKAKSQKLNVSINIPDEMGMEIIPSPSSPGSYSVAATEPNTPSPKQQGCYSAMDAPFNHLPRVC